MKLRDAEYKSTMECRASGQPIYETESSIHRVSPGTTQDNEYQTSSPYHSYIKNSCSKYRYDSSKFEHPIFGGLSFNDAESNQNYLDILDETDKELIIDYYFTSSHSMYDSNISSQKVSETVIDEHVTTLPNIQHVLNWIK